MCLFANEWNCIQVCGLSDDEKNEIQDEIPASFIDFSGQLPTGNQLLSISFVSLENGDLTVQIASVDCFISALP